jgi:hypothetical protein
MSVSYLIKVENGTAKLYSSDGRFHRTIGRSSNITSGVVQGDVVQLTTDEGRIEIYNLNGNFQRSL